MRPSSPCRAGGGATHHGNKKEAWNDKQHVEKPH